MILEKFKLTDRVALVTGAATGLGAEIAIGLAEAGAQVACHEQSL
jgi:NAD(P)-dependent dehydrogenase (short-subunit alcohol dehydrogenase family)